ncbi:MAG: GNAT family N-acetyltransferase [Bacteroidota bacterium]
MDSSLLTERLQLRKLQKSDLSDLHTILSSPQVAKFNTIGVSDSLETTQNHFQSYFSEDEEESKIFGWSIRTLEGEVFLGQIGINMAPKRYRKAEIHYSILPEHWGKGYATEAVSKIIAYCFNTLNLHRVEAGCAVDNIGSIRVLEKTGMIKEGRGRKILPLSTGWSDNFAFAILEEEFRQVK